MKIAITGLTASGKNTLAELVAKELSYKLVEPTFKDLAKEEGISLMEFQKKAEKDHNIDKKFDDLLKKQVSKGNCVVSTWLGPWIVNPDITIQLFAPLDIRAMRVSKRDKMPLDKAKKHVQERDNSNRKRYLDVYNIDIFDTSSFDACLSSHKYTPEKLKEIVLQIIKTNKKI
ncbi:MAG TPA: cytidylate kinase family protein [Candidatus Bilamarchaeaceae archaeon]|nr:cytidylate kinase family protein [Candidatus Bilamarchaeaceae archaeon]